MPKEHHAGRDYADRMGMPPEAYRGGLYDHEDGVIPDKREQRITNPGPGAKGKRTVANAKPSGFNLKGVMEVLAEHGLDPTAEIAAILMARKPVTKRDGTPVYDPETLQPLTEPALDIDLRAKVLLELQQYVHPKLKSIEHTVKPSELTETQVEARLAALLERATPAAPAAPPTK